MLMHSSITFILHDKLFASSLKALWSDGRAVFQDVCMKHALWINLLHTVIWCSETRPLCCGQRRVQLYHKRNQVSVFLSWVLAYSFASSSVWMLFWSCCLKPERPLLCLVFFSQNFSFFQCSAPLYPHPKELWGGEHQGLLHWPEGRILWGQSWLLNKISFSSLPLEP